MVSPRVFVSHSHQDATFCRDYVNGLRARGADVWYDEHDLGWGALRATIEREMPTCQHFVGILSPAAVASEWVNAEIDAAIELLKEQTLKTFTFVIAEPCVVPLLLRRWKRIEGPGGAAASVVEAVARTAVIIGLPVPAPVPTSRAQPPVAPAPRPAPQQATPATAHPMPTGVSRLGYTAQRSGGSEYIVPPLCDVPAGAFLMGSDKRKDPAAYDNELPQQSVTLGAYRIGRYPVTVAEYACFVKGGQRAPSDWQRQLGRLDHPVVSVSWHDASAYAAWLARVTGQPWRLPSEAEWEKAARGSDGRIYPWGDQWDTARANTREGGKGGTTVVGGYPTGASPCGAQDMAGNVWEWTSSVYQAYPYSATDGRERAESTENRVLRGGSWYRIARYARVAYRYGDRPDLVVNNYGFRLMCAVPSS